LEGGSQKSAGPAYRELPKRISWATNNSRWRGAEVLAIVKDGVGVPTASAGDNVEIVTDRTSFYGDSGGRPAIPAGLPSADGNTTVAEIQGVSFRPGVRAQRPAQGAIAVGDHVRTRWTESAATPSKRNHTDHLLHAAFAAGFRHACEAGRLGGSPGLGCASTSPTSPR